MGKDKKGKISKMKLKKNPGSKHNYRGNSMRNG